MVNSTARRTLARQLRKQGLSYRQIKTRVPASLDSLYRWCKDLTTEQTDTRTDFRVNNTGVKETGNVGVKVKGKTFPVWLGIVIIIGVVIFTFVSLWLRNPEKEPDEQTDKKSKSRGLGGRSYEELTGEEFEPLPNEEI